MSSQSVGQSGSRSREHSSPGMMTNFGETKWSLLTTEFWAMVGVIAAILIASAISDSLGDVRAWLYVSIVAAAYIVSLGLAKSGSRANHSEDRAPTR